MIEDVNMQNTCGFCQQIVPARIRLKINEGLFCHINLVFVCSYIFGIVFFFIQICIICILREKKYSKSNRALPRPTNILSRKVNFPFFLILDIFQNGFICLHDYIFSDGVLALTTIYKLYLVFLKINFDSTNRI